MAAPSKNALNTRRWRAKRKEAMAEAARRPTPVPPPEPKPLASKPQFPKFWTRFVIPGTGVLTYAGNDLDRGQLMDLKGMPLDEKLERLGYVAKVDEHARPAQCGVCGAWFLSERFRDLHGNRRHKNRFEGEENEYAATLQSPMGVAGVIDLTGDREEKQLMAEAPLYLDKTIASQQA